MNKKSMSTSDIAMAGLLMALITVMTYLVKIPVIATKGYVNIGDGFIFLTVLLVGHKQGGVVAGVGSGLSDFIGGYPHYVIPTFIIKFLMGYIMGLILKFGYARYKDEKKRKTVKFLSMIISAIIMVVGYFIAETIMYGSAGVALASAPMNVVQGSVGVIIGMSLSAMLVKTSAKNKFLYK